jgi:hypothetical protein
MADPIITLVVAMLLVAAVTTVLSRVIPDEYDRDRAGPA